jgi:succinate-semialdehyde dehydrogenase/glutarate-semialdehyde dehydrogenase
VELQSINPANGMRLATYPEHSEAEIQNILNRAVAAQKEWRDESISKRAELMARVAALLRRNKERNAELAAREMGKPIQQARTEIEKCAACCDFYAGQAAEFLRTEEVKTEATRSYVLFQPLGVLLAIMPWNFPFWQAIRAAVPALMAGNTVVLKHASNVSGCALAIESLFREAGADEGLFSVALISSRRASALISDPAISAVTLTGSTEAGKAVAAAAGANLKKTVLELGGSDPYLILEDADLETAAEICATSRLINSGQSCIAAKRFIVIESIRERFELLFLETMRKRKMGEPLDPATEVGPLARADLRDALHEQVERSLRAGAKLLLGGKMESGPGAYYPPTVLGSVQPGMAAFDEETFGPVAAVVTARDEHEAIAFANSSSFGLGAAVFTRNRKRGERVAEQLETGSCFINDYVRSDPRLPFGGIKLSGYGRELGLMGIREFVNIKTVCVR